MSVADKIKKLLGKFTKKRHKRETNEKYVAGEVEKAIRKGIRKGESIPNITKRVLGVSNKSKNSATLTARTEVTRIQNAGRLDAMENAQSVLGVSVKKVWIATNDRRTRDSHAAIDGEVVPLNEEFSNGLERPGDPNGEAAEICNCRCTMTSELEL